MYRYNKKSLLKIAAIIVSYNKEKLLRKNLNSILKAKLLPNIILVVDNASKDNSLNTARNIFINDINVKNKTVHYEIIALNYNVGGTGGFTIGISHSISKYNVDLVWVMDDDVIVTENTLKRLFNAWVNYSKFPDNRPAFISPKVLYKNKKKHLFNSHKRCKSFIEIRKSANKVGGTPIRHASFISLLISVNDIRKKGLPIANYFLWNDDFEYTIRLSYQRIGIYLPSSIVYHLSSYSNKKELANIMSIRFFLEVRNKIWFLKYSKYCTMFEKFFYFSKFILLWMQCLYFAKNKKITLLNFSRGLMIGLLTKPKANNEYLKNVKNIFRKQNKKIFVSINKKYQNFLKKKQ